MSASESRTEKRQRPAVKALAIDLLVLLLAVLLAELFRGGFLLEGRWPWVGGLTVVLAVGAAGAMSLVLETFRVRSSSLVGRDVGRMAQVAAAAGFVVGVSGMIGGFEGGWFMQVLLTFFFALSGLIAIRFWGPGTKVVAEVEGEIEGRRTVLLGAGAAALMLVNELAGEGKRDTIVGFLDDDPKKHGSTLHGYPVLGPIADIGKVVKEQKATDVILAIPSLSVEGQKRVLGYCEGLEARVRMMPSISRMLAESGKGLPFLRDIGPEELLNRDSIETDMSGAEAYLSGKTVLITGGGGSIGSELARQVAQLGPKQLILMGKGENSIFEAELDMKQRGVEGVVGVIGDVRDRESVDRVMGAYRPDVVFHAAAHKHVPLMEQVPIEAVRNNIFGTLNVGQSAIAHGVDRMILISTDKAVHPSNVMGATKRMAEMVIIALAGLGETQFSAVRFGNVLGSRGSLIPILKNQIKKGGPITITDERMTRFFMTIPEAAQLVVQAGSHGGKGEIFILDMGEPVKIMDIARGLLRLYGLKEGKDIDIKIVGARPGEKIHEVLAWENEDLERFDGGKIMRLMNHQPVGWEEISLRLDKLRGACEAGDPEVVRELLMSMVCEQKAVVGENSQSLPLEH